MKLSPTQIGHVEHQMGFQAVPDNHPVLADLEGTFGNHTFFLDRQGLNIVEVDAESDGAGVIFKLASWASDNMSELLPHDPEMRPATVDLSPEDPDPAA